MTEFTLQLPPRKSSISRLSRLNAHSRQKLTDDLLHAIWESAKSRELPPTISHVVRDWVAHARFEQNPVIAERRAQVHNSAD